MDSREQEYRRQIEIAQRYLQRAQSDVDRAAWQNVLTGWQRLLSLIAPQPQLQQQPQQQLDEKPDEDGK